MYENGGIYLDSDVLCLKPLDEFRNIEGSKGGCVIGQEGAAWDQEGKLTNAILLAEKDSEFVENWLMSFKGFDDTWAKWGVQLPLALPNIMQGINQCTMMALAMVVIASMIGVVPILSWMLRKFGHQSFSLVRSFENPAMGMATRLVVWSSLIAMGADDDDSDDALSELMEDFSFLFLPVVDIILCG